MGDLFSGHLLDGLKRRILEGARVHHLPRLVPPSAPGVGPGGWIGRSAFLQQERSVSPMVPHSSGCPRLPPLVRPRLPRAAPAKRRKAPRPPQPRMPDDFFSAQALDLAHRAAEASAPPAGRRIRCRRCTSIGRESEPHWGDVAQQRCSGTTLRIAGKRVLYESLSMDLERGLRLLTLAWTPEGMTADGHTLRGLARGAGRASSGGSGRYHREFVRRKGEEEAREAVRLTMNTLWWVKPPAAMDGAWHSAIRNRRQGRSARKPAGGLRRARQRAGVGSESALPTWWPQALSGDFNRRMFE